MSNCDTQIKLVLRGHIRNSFDTKQLYDFILKLVNTYPNLKIFIHTWNIYANNISWRNIKTNNNIVSKEVINDYFGNLSKYIEHIIIDDDKEIKLYGRLTGSINGCMPILGWKNYWYGKQKIINYIYENYHFDDSMIINTRFDVFSNSNSYCNTDIYNFIRKYDNVKFTKNVFLSDQETNGIDNFYIGNINTMCRLVNIFYHDLDNIIQRFTDTQNQEKFVFRMNDILFN